jgi:hypothetical protein
MLEAQILSALLKKQTWVEYNSVLDWPALKQQAPEINRVFLVVKKWHDTRDNDLGMKELPMYFALQYPGMNDKEKANYQAIFEQAARAEVRDDLIASYLQQMKDMQVRKTIALLAIDDKISNEKVIAQVGQLSSPAIAEEEEIEFVTTDIDVLVQEATDNVGLFWSLECLNKSIGPIGPGVLGGVIGRKETGKTAFWVSQVANFLPQLKDDEQVAIFFNEEQGKAVMWRLYSAVCGMSYAEIVNDQKKAKELFYARGGERIKFKDMPFHTEDSIKRVLDALNPAIIVIDSFDKLKGFKADRKDLELGAAYKFGRETAKTYAPVLAISQADAGGFNKKYLTELDMADSKTAKPAELDFLIGIGRTDEAGYEYVRYLNIPVNKLPASQYKDEKDRHGKFQTIIMPELSLYRDV